MNMYFSVYLLLILVQVIEKKQRLNRNISVVKVSPVFLTSDWQDLLLNVVTAYELSGTSAGGVFVFLLCVGYRYNIFVHAVFLLYNKLSSLFRLSDISLYKTHRSLSNISLYETHRSLCDVGRLWKFLGALSLCDIRC